jgi:2'-5' RNA ligase
MPFAVYLDLDAAGSRRFDQFTGIIEGLCADISTPGRLGHTHHITLGVYDAVDISGLEKALSEIPSNAVELTFPAVGSFPGERSVLFAAPTVTRDLLDLHEHYHQVSASCGSCHEHYKPGAWFPHMTLAMNLTRDDLNAAMNAISNRWVSITCRADAIRLVRFSPVETLSIWPLGPC